MFSPKKYGDPYAGFQERGKRVEHALPAIGKRLYQAAFGSPAAAQIIQRWQQHPAQERQISIISDVPRALNVPWELLHDEDGFLAVRTPQPVSIVRRLPEGASEPHPIPFQPPLRILLVTARPEGEGFVDPRSIAHELVDELQEQMGAGTVALEFLRPATYRALGMRLRDRKHPVHLLHFDGHGVFDETKGQGMLAFENEAGWLDAVQATDLSSLLQRSGVQLVVLTACQSALGTADDAFSSVAAQLIRAGMDAVIAMSASVLVASATRYSEAFYRAIAAGVPVPVAHERARQQLQHESRRHLQHRHLDEEGQPVELHDWWLPHFYQQRALTFQLQPSHESYQSRPAPGEPLQRMNEEMPAAPRYGFTGRARELLKIERALLQGKLIVLHGFGGIGKTAVARESADWLTRSGMYARACFISFEHGGDASTLLSALGHFLGIYNATYNPQDRAAALAALAPALKQHPTLLLADNLESLLSDGEAPLELEGRVALWETLRELSRLQAGVLLTSREPSVGDGRLARGEHVTHVSLNGMHPEDAFLLARSVLEKLKIDRTRAPYTELRDLLKQLDYHPLAIQSVLPALRAHSLETIRRRFADLLPQFTDDAASGHNRSLLASLQYSLERLSDEQRVLLPRLAVFEGGANEDDLLAITRISKSDWASLRPALEQAALLVPERVHEDVPVHFLHFHPVLAPFLRSQPGADDPELYVRFAEVYCGLADFLYEQDQRYPQAVRALALRELPNMRRALSFLLQKGERETALTLASRMSHFLHRSGRLRERDELQRLLTSGDLLTERLTPTEFLYETGLGENELERGDVEAALGRFSALLSRMEALPEGVPMGPGSFEYSVMLARVSRCLLKAGNIAAAEAPLRKALAIIAVLLKQAPEDRVFVGHKIALLVEWGNLSSGLGRYAHAREAYEQGLRLARQEEVLTGQAVLMERLGEVAFLERRYGEARAHYAAARGLYHSLREPAGEAVCWHQLGYIAQDQKDWSEAERCYRESLRLEEQHGNLAGAADTSNQLGMVALMAGRFVEAEGWYRRALQLDEDIRPGSLEHAKDFNNLADLLVTEIHEGRIPVERLSEARSYAEQALALKENLDASAAIWRTFSVLAKIAEVEGQPEAVRAYRRREREAFAAHAGNRYHIDRQHRQLIAAAVGAARGSDQAREELAEAVSQLEASGWPVTVPILAILLGERNWHALAEDLDRESALLLLCILEALADPSSEDREQRGELIEQFILAVVAAGHGHQEARKAVEETLPQLEAGGWHIADAIRRIWTGERDQLALVEGLDDEDARIIVQILHLLGQPQGETSEAAATEAKQRDDLLERLAVAVHLSASGNQEARAAVEQVLPQLEAHGWHVTAAVQRIWAGERDAAALIAGLDEQDALLIRRIIALLAT